MDSENKITIFDIAKNTKRFTSKELTNVAREYSMDGFFRLFDSENSTLIKSIYEFDLKTNTVKIPDFDLNINVNIINDSNDNNNNEFEDEDDNIILKMFKNEPVDYSTFILFMDSLFYQTNFLNVYTNNVFTRNYNEGKYLVVGSHVKAIVDYLNYKIPEKLPYVYCNIDSMSYNYTSKESNIFSNIYEMSKTNSFDYYTTHTTSFKEFENTIKLDFGQEFDHLIVSSNLPLKYTNNRFKTIEYEVFDEFGILKNEKIEVKNGGDLEFDKNDIIKENFVMPTVYESYMSLVDCLGIGGSCVIICDKNDSDYLNDICMDAMTKFTELSVIHPILMSNTIILICRNYTDNIIITKINDLQKMNLSRIIKRIVNEFKKSIEIDVSKISMTEIQKLTGCM